MQAQRAELRMLDDLGSSLSLDHLVLLPPFTEPGAVLTDLRHELLVLPLSRVACVLGAKSRERVASGCFPLRSRPLLTRVDHQQPQQISPVGSQMVNRA